MPAFQSKQPSGHGHRIKSRRLEMQFTQTAIANHIGVTPPTIGQWEREETMPKGENAIRLAELLEVTPEWIITGSQSAQSTASLPGVKAALVPLVPIDALHKKFVISELDSVPEEYRATCLPVSSDSFAVRITGDAMLNPHGGPSIPDGTVLIVDPQVPYSDNSFVVAITKNSGNLIRQFMEDGPNRWLRALNPEYTKLEFKKSDKILACAIAIETDLVPGLAE